MLGAGALLHSVTELHRPRGNCAVDTSDVCQAVQHRKANEMNDHLGDTLKHQDISDGG